MPALVQRALACFQRCEKTKTEDLPVRTRSGARGVGRKIRGETPTPPRATSNGFKGYFRVFKTRDGAHTNGLGGGVCTGNVRYFGDLLLTNARVSYTVFSITPAAGQDRV